jgi:hypothetical protein
VTPQRSGGAAELTAACEGRSHSDGCRGLGSPSSDDKASPTEPYVFGQPVDLVEVPVTWGLDDFPPFEFVWGMNSGLTSPSDVEEIWCGDFDYTYQHATGRCTR